jgi:Protein kinase domain
MAAAGYEVTSLVRTVHSTIGLIEKAVTLIKDYGQSDRDAQLLLPHLESDADSLKTVLRVLTDIGNSADGILLNEGEQRLHSDIESYLILLEKRLRQRTERLAVGTQADPGRSASLGARNTPTPWSREDLRQLERNLNDWIRRFQLIYSVIDAEITLSTLSPSTPAKRVNAHINIFSQLTLEDVSAEELYRDVSKLHAGGKPSRRMCATYQSKANKELPVIAEYIYKPYLSDLDPAEISKIGTAVFSLAKVLHRSDPDQTQILKCDGYFHDEKTFRFGLIYEIPPNLSCHSDANGAKRVLSLSDLFTQIPRFSMSHRFRFACDVAKAVLYVHLAGWVHKSIRPNNVIILEDPSLDRVRRFPYSLPRPFLAGFEYARSLKTASNRSSDAEWQLNIYRHPKRQFLERNSMYNMSHDVYSLGVVFLELGLWGSAGFVPFQMSEELFKGKSGEQMKEVLLSLARGSFTESSKEKGVAVQMGDRYEELVRYCLEIDHKEELPSAAFVQEIWLRLDEMRSALC